VNWGASYELIPPAYVKRLVDGITGATLTAIDDVGHVAAYEQTDTVLAAIPKPHN